MFGMFACADKQETVDKQDEVWVPGWQLTSAMPTPRAGAAAVVYNDIIYLIGGVAGREIFNDSIYARINKDGSVGQWQQGPALLEERVFIDAVARDGFVYVVGGGNGPNGGNYLNSVERAKILPDGSLGAWATESKMALPRRCSKVLILDDSIYTFGGFGGVLLDSVEYSAFKADGSLEAWQVDSEKLTMPRYVIGVKKWRDKAYVIGGHDQNKGIGITDVEWSHVSPSGGMQKWKATSSLQTGRYGLSTAAHGDYVYALGGLTGAEYLDSIEKSKGSVSGELGEWQETTALMQPRATFSTLVYKDWIYVLGGTNRDGYLNTVEYATFNKEGDIGFKGSKLQAQAYLAELEKRKSKKLELPNEGIVKQVLDASAYSYVQVLNDKEGLIWIAGPKTTLTTGTKIQYSTGVFMSNFFSKELQQAFPSVLFVGTIQ
ncbi:MAG: hypothetical protein GXP19_04765, partial [Gammaproteobacteria bacterium]|nr:hypothetical protein [Gammaproteobacteria bacterium]